MGDDCAASAAVARGHMTQQDISHPFVNLQQECMSDALFTPVLDHQIASWTYDTVYIVIAVRRIALATVLMKLVVFLS